VLLLLLLLLLRLMLHIFRPRHRLLALPCLRKVVLRFEILAHAFPHLLLLHQLA